jgi:hypothetical protein
MASIPIALWRGENERAGALLARLLSHAMRHSQGYWKSWAHSYQQVLAARASGTQPRLGVELSPIDALSGPAELDMLGTLAQSAVSAHGVERVDEGQVGWCAAEILRADAENRLRNEPRGVAAAEAALMRALAIARTQSALSWELRAATSLARLWRDHGRRRDARVLLSDTYDRFDEGLATADLLAARTLVDELG